MSNSRLWALALLALAAILWGGTPVAMRYIMLDHPSSTAIFARMVPAGLIAVCMLCVMGLAKLQAREWLRLGLAAFCGYFAYQAFAGFGIALIPSSWTGVLFCLEPIFIALGAVLFLGERMGPLAITGLCLAMAGTVLLAITGENDTGQSSLWGVVLIVLSSVGWAIYTLLVRPLAEKHGGFRISILAIAMTALPTLAFSSPTLLADVATFGTAQWLAVVYVALFSTVVAVACWTVALPHVPSSQAAMFLYLQPLVAALGGMALLGESLGLWFLAGGALIIIGVFLNQAIERKAP